jgi:A/G-specific adenine glycosylase
VTEAVPSSRRKTPPGRVHSIDDPLDSDAKRRVRDLLLGWWDAGHRDLPWRRTRDPYAVLVSEIMLQQTQVSRVAPKYEAFLARFPTLAALAEAPVAEVIRAWSGLGYNRRAVNLHRLARFVVEEHGGELPRSVEALRRLPGIGPYTARAVAAIAFGEVAAPVDTNVRRVLTRVVDGAESSRSPAGVQALADAMLARKRPGDWSQALMELGARVCLPAPDCPACPLREPCATAPAAQAIRERRAAYRAGGTGRSERFEHSTRFYRGRIVEMLRAADGGALGVDDCGRRLRLDYTADDRPWLAGLVEGLARDHLVSFDGEAVSLPSG